MLAVLVVACESAVGARAAWAQGVRSPFVPMHLARRHGLEQVWATQIQVDVSRGRVVSVTPFVSSSRTHTFFEVTHEFGRTLISERQLDVFRRPLLIEGAKKLAETRVQELRELNPDSKVEVKSVMRVVPEVTLYATTENGTVHAIDGETGKTRWVTTVGKYHHPTTEAAANENYVAVINGSSIYLLNSQDGTFVWQKQMMGVPVAGPALSDEYVFASTTQGMVESYTLKDVSTPAWIYKGAGRTLVAPVAANDTVAWPTDRGHVYVASTNPRAMRYRLESHHMCNSSPAIVGARLFATSVDGYLYCMNLGDGQGNAQRVHWKFSLGQSSSVAPVVVRDQVLVLTDQNYLFCVSLVDGVERWRAAGVRRLIGASNDRVYVAGAVGQLAVLNAATGGRLATIQAEGVDLQVTNPLTDRLYVGSSSGALQCLREMTLEWPVVHTMPTEKPKVHQKVKQVNGPADGDGMAPAAGPPADDDPFGAKPAAPKPAAPPADDDPFGVKPAAPKPAPADADPFAS